MSNITKWPEEIQPRTAEEWNGLVANWSDQESRTTIVNALKALKVPATEYARKQPPERVAMVIELQEKLLPGTTTGAKAAAPAAATAAKKQAAPKATAAATSTVAGAGGTFDLSPVTARLDALDAKVDGLAATLGNIETLLKLILLNPANLDSLQLAADPDVLAEFAGKSITELAGGNG